MSFRFKIGDHVTVESIAKDSIKYVSMVGPVRPADTMTVVGTLIEECIGGVQYFYVLQRWDGISTTRYAESTIIPADEYYDQWMNAISKY